MKVVGWTLCAAMIVAVAQAIAAVLALVIAGALIWAFCKAPREAFGLVGLVAVVGMLKYEPLICLGILTLLVVARAFRRG